MFRRPSIRENNSKENVKEQVSTVVPIPDEDSDVIDNK
jgi:hypothetical protein